MQSAKKVADAFAELYGMEKIVVLDALWQEWFNAILYLTAKKMQLNNILYEEVFNCLSKEKQLAIIGRKADFAKKAGITQ